MKIQLNFASQTCHKMRNNFSCIAIFLSILLSFAATGVESKWFSGDAGDDNNPGEPLFLTKHIENGNIKEAQKMATVTHPDMETPSYAGYFTVNKEYNSNLYFWYFPAAENPDEAPVVLWLAGGPGQSSMLNLFMENGPYNITAEQKLVPRKYSWHLNHHLIYIDNPVGTGFSFTKSEKGYATNEIDIGQNLLNALQQFFRLFPNLQRNEFYLTGESYAGKYVPAVGYAIHEANNRELSELTKPKINLKGLAIGNGWTDPIHQVNYADYLYQLGLIDFNTHDEFVKQQNEAIECIKNRNFLCAHHKINRLYGETRNLTGFKDLYNFLNIPSVNGPDSQTVHNCLHKSDIRRAIHVGNHEWLDVNRDVQALLKLDVFESVADWMVELLSHYRVLVYNGQLDIIVAYPLTENYLRNLNFSAAAEYKTAKRSIWCVDKEIAGYVKRAGNLTEVLIRNAGHAVARDQPKWALDMLKKFTHHDNFRKCRIDYVKNEKLISGAHPNDNTQTHVAT